MSRLNLFALIIVLATTGCAQREVMSPMLDGAVAPAGVNFSGTWLLRSDESDGQRSINRAVSQAGGKNGSSSSKRKSGTGRVQVFLETGSLLKITQTIDGFFVSVDRSVVEEFRFGENRMINIGDIEAQRVSGWDGAVYMVQTLDEGGMKMIDRFWLSDDEDVLLREITFRGRNEKTATVTQFFDRKVR